MSEFAAGVETRTGLNSLTTKSSTPKIVLAFVIALLISSKT